MQRKTRSILEELDSMYHARYNEQDKKYIIESRANNVIASAIRLVEQIEENFDEQQSNILVRKLLNAIRDKDASKFTKTVRRTNAT